MPNAAARLDDDFDLDAPKPKKAPRRTAPSKGRGSKGKKGKKHFWSGLDMTRVARLAAIAMSVAIALGIMVNALMMQTGHHPAPLFGKSIALGEAARVAPPASAPRPAPTLAAREPAPEPPAKPQAALAQEAAPAQADAPAADPIARLLAGGPAGDKGDAKTVSGAQRALTKLGFSVKATGTLGPQTKKAIEAFEKDRHLPVKGELSRRVLKVLAAESGLRIDR